MNVKEIFRLAILGFIFGILYIGITGVLPSLFSSHPNMNDMRPLIAFLIAGGSWFSLLAVSSQWVKQDFIRCLIAATITGSMAGVVFWLIMKPDIMISYAIIGGIVISLILYCLTWLQINNKL